MNGSFEKHELNLYERLKTSLAILYVITPEKGFGNIFSMRIFGGKGLPGPDALELAFTLKGTMSLPGNAITPLRGEFHYRKKTKDASVEQWLKEHIDNLTLKGAFGHD